MFVQRGDLTRLLLFAVAGDAFTTIPPDVNSTSAVGAPGGTSTTVHPSLASREFRHTSIIVFTNDTLL